MIMCGHMTTMTNDGGLARRPGGTGGRGASLAKLNLSKCQSPSDHKTSFFIQLVNKPAESKFRFFK